MNEMDGGGKGAMVWGGDTEEERGTSSEFESGNGGRQVCGGSCEIACGHYLSTSRVPRGTGPGFVRPVGGRPHPPRDWAMQSEAPQESLMAWAGGAELG